MEIIYGFISGSISDILSTSCFLLFSIIEIIDVRDSLDSFCPT